MDWLRHDLRLAARLLGRRPGFSLLAILTLALGLSVNTVAFSAVNAPLFKPFRFAGADHTGWLFVATARNPLANSSLPVFEALDRGATTIDAVAAEGRMPLAFDAARRAARGVRNVAVADRVSFFVGVPTTRPVSLDGRDCAATDCPRAGVYAAAPEFFDTMGIPLVLGRVYDPNRPADRNAVVISATAAEAFWPGEYPIGRSFRLEPDARTLTVAGVAADIVHRGMNERRQSYVYRPLAAADFGASFTVVARAADDVDAALAALGQGVHAIDPRLPPQSLETMRDRMALPLWMPRTAAGFFGACGAAAVLLSTIGLFGVTYFAVSQRRREFGVRFALGATRADVRRLVFGETFRLAGPGILAGAGLAVVAAFAIRSALLGLATGSPTPYVAAVLVQGAIAALASWSPAARAARSSPLEVLRAE